MQNSIGGAELRSLGPVAKGGGKQPTVRTARAQRTVRPRIVSLGLPLTKRGDAVFS